MNKASRIMIALSVATGVAAVVSAAGEQSLTVSLLALVVVCQAATIIIGEFNRAALTAGKREGARR